MDSKASHTAEEIARLREIIALLERRLTETAEQTAETLDASEVRYRTLLATVPQLVWATDAEGHGVYQAPQWHTLTGRSPEESLGAGWLQWVHPDDRAHAAAAWLDASHNGQRYQVEYRLRTVDGTYRWMLARANAVRNAQGTITGWIGTSTDIHDRKMAERTIRDRDAHLRLALDASHALTFEWDIVRDQVRRLFSNEEALPQTQGAFETFEDVVRVVHTDDRAQFRENVRSALVHSAGLYVSEHRIVRPDGVVRWLHESGVVEFDEARGPMRLLGISLDITDRVEGERARLERDALLRTVIESTADLVWAKDESGRISLGNQATFDLLGGGDPKRVLGLGAGELMPNPMEAQRIADNDALVVRSGRPQLVEETFGSPASPRVFQTLKSPLRDASGAVVGVVGVSRDVTEARRNEHRLREAEARLQLATQAAGIGVFDIDLHADRVYWSPEACAILGVPVGTVGTTSMSARLAHPDDRESIGRATTAALDPSGDGLLDMTYRIRRADTGETHWISVRSQTSFLGQAEARRAIRLTGAFSDVTERKRHEQHAAALTALSMAFATRQDPRDLISHARHTLVSHLAVDVAVMSTVTPDAAEASPVPSWSSQPPTALSTVSLADYITEESRAELVAGRPLIIHDTATDPRTAFASARYGDVGVGAAIAVPLLTERGLTAMLTISVAERRRWRDDEVRFATDVMARLWPSIQRARSERAVRSSKARLDAAMEAAHICGWELDVATGAMWWSENASAVMGVPHTALPRTLTDMTTWCHPDDTPQVTQAVDDVLRGVVTTLSSEHRVIHPVARDVIWLLVHGTMELRDDGASPRIVGLTQNVTRRKQNERALAARNQQLEMVAGTAQRLMLGTAPERELLASIFGDIALLIDMEMFYHYRPAEEPLGLRLTTQGGISDDEQLRFAEMRVGESLCRRVAASRERLIIEDLQQSELCGADALRTSGVTSYAGFPLLANGELLGTIAFVSRRRARLENGDVQMIQTICDQIAATLERRRLQQELAMSEAAFRAMADQTPIVMWVTNAGGGIEFVNDAYYTFFGVTVSQVLAHGWQPLVHPEDGAYVTVVMSALTARKPFRARARVRRADGEWRWIASSGVPRVSATGEFLGMIGVSPDVTDQLRASELEREAARQKDEFIAVLAHELRNPLAPIRTSVGVLRASGPAEPKLAKCRDIIERQVAHMTRLLDDLLDVSRLSRAEFTLQRTTVRLRDVVDAAVETVRPAMDDRHHTLEIAEVDPSLSLDADGARLTQVLTNILSNAAKYTNPRGRIALRVDTHDAQVVVRVQDNGIGLRPELRERIFDLFTQAEDARYRAEGGLGIGLALTKRLVQMHGGTITAESPGPQRGSTFTVTLPLHVDAHQLPATSAAPAASTMSTRSTESAALGVPRRRTLVVDDNVDAADTLSMLLEVMGCDTRTVYDGESALREAATFRPDLVLLDLGMPDLGGQAVCARLREEHWGAHIVIAAVTGWGQEEDRRRTKMAGFDHHLVKPVDPAVLEKLVRELPEQRVT